MKVSELIPSRFSTRLIAMTLLSGLVPIIIFSLIMQVAAIRFPSDTNQAIQQGEKEQWRRMEVVLRNMAEDFIHQKATDVALQMDLYLGAHPKMKVAELQKDPVFREIAIQPVGTGYTAVFDSDTAINCFHKVRSIQGMDISKTAEKWPVHWEIIKASLGGKDSKGYYEWEEPNGEMRDKFMYIAPLNLKTADNVRFAVAATTYIDDFFKPLHAAQEVSLDMATRLMETVNGLIRSFRDRGFLVMGLGLLLVLALSYWVGTYFSRAIVHLRDATKKINQGDFNHHVALTTSGDVGELIEDFNQMVSQLASTTVKKEQLEVSENMLKAVNARLVEEIAERKQAEEALKEGEERFRSIVENSHNGISIMDSDYHFIYVNQEWCIIFGYAAEEMIDRDFRNFLSDSSNLIIKDRSIRREKGRTISNRFEFDIIRKDGETRHVEASDSMIKDSAGNVRIIAQMLDITERKRAQEERKKLEAKLQHARRMEAIGTLAGGVAHDLNNILSGLVSYPELLLMDMPEDSPFKKPILTIQKSGEKAAAIVQDLLTLARRGVQVSGIVNLNQVILEYLRSPECEKLKAYHPQVTIETRLEKGLLNMIGSPIHLAKTVMNLVSNAAEAIVEEGEVIISTENQYIDIPIKHKELDAGEYVVLSISDTGIGISPDDVERIFEPFYTKKVMGRTGTGLGMAVVWGTVQDHNGYIDIQTHIHEGTTFTLYFPATREKAEKARSEIPIIDYMGKGESILVVDDIEEQREIASKIFDRLGYKVELASSGEEAVEYLKKHTADLVVLDMIMDPGMDGLETYQRILEIHPGQKAIIASGFSETDRVKQTLQLGAGAYIRKPYLLEKIGLAVREALDK